MDRYRILEQTLRKLSFAVKRKGREILRRYDLTPAQFDVMVLLYFHGPLRASAIAQRMGLAKSTVSGLLDRLKERKLVGERPDPQDRRAYLVFLSAQGKRVIHRVIERRVSFIRKLSQDFPEERLDRLIEDLQTLLRRAEPGALE